MQTIIYVVNSLDNVGTAMGELREGEAYPVMMEGGAMLGEIRVKTRIPKWYKVALRNIAEGEKIIKHGYPIGIGIYEIPKGYVVHITNVMLADDFDFKELLGQGFILGEALKRVEKGEILAAWRNFRPTHPALRSMKRGEKIGIAVSPIAEGGYIRLGNIIDLERTLGWNEKYRRLVRDFYRFLKASFEDFSRVP